MQLTLESEKVRGIPHSVVPPLAVSGECFYLYIFLVWIILIKLFFEVPTTPLVS